MAHEGHRIELRVPEDGELKRVERNLENGQ